MTVGERFIHHGGIECAVRSMSETLFLHYDRAALDEEYDNRAKVAGAED